eukprot:832262-Heterocapsa_arctica.AAC.1
MGYVTPEIIDRLPLYLSLSAGLKFECADATNGLAAISRLPDAGWGKIRAIGAFCETAQDQSSGIAASK